MQIYSLFFQTQLARNFHGRCCKSWSNFLGNLHRLWTSSDIAVKGLALIWYCWDSKSIPLSRADPDVICMRRSRLQSRRCSLTSSKGLVVGAVAALGAAEGLAAHEVCSLPVRYIACQQSWLKADGATDLP